MNLQRRDLKLDLSGDDVRLLQSELARLGLSVPEVEQQQASFGQGTREAVIRLQKERGLDPTGVVDAQTASTIRQVMDAITYTVEGTVTSPDHAGLGELHIQIVDKNIGQDDLLAETTIDIRGSYLARFVATSLRERGKKWPDLQARVYAGQVFLAASDIRYNASNQETLDVKLPANSTELPSEYETLTATLAGHYAGQLRDLKESNDHQDLTYLANKTGWDARAIALAALADQFSQSQRDRTGTPAIKPVFYYALFRAGLPTDADTLYSTDAQSVEEIWKQAIAQGVIPKALEQELPNTVHAFQSLSATHALDTRAFNGTSTLREMLQLSLGDDAQRQLQFADLYVRYRNDLPAFWDAVKQSFGEQTAKHLQLDGQLGFLTLNNAPLISRLHNAEGQNPLSSTLDLAQRGYYRAEQWSSLLDGSIPEQIPGSTPDEKRTNYAKLLAAQVRLSFPTTVVAEMVHSHELPLADDSEVRDGIHAFLTEHQNTFWIGMQPIEQYLASKGLVDAVSEPVKEQIKRLQRVYQITPSDQAMTGLLKHNLDSAYQVVRYDEAEFVRRFSDELGGQDMAQLTYAKAQQVHNVVLNITTSYLTARQLPALGSGPQALVIDPTPDGLAPRAAAASDVIAYPTLEGLFGSMDYCTCEQCRSILSPAAYLVDLLLFLDNPPGDPKNPQNVLLGRRPDIQYLSLTCENTNMPVPSIDLINETLEYFVANNLSLVNYIGHDTSSDTTDEELLANPQFVNDAAYVALKAELFPPPLPFHQPLEALRRFFDKFKVPLHVAMETLRVDDSIERASDNSYGWRDILMEELKLSRAEYRLLTDRTLTLQQLYGYAPTTPDADVLTGLANVKAFTRRVGVMYEDIIELLKTKFVNPNSALIPQLERLGVPFSTLKALKDGTISDAAFDVLLPAGLDRAKYGGNIEKWVRDNYVHIMGLITIANPTNSTYLCSFDALEFRYANPDNTANSLRPIEYVRLLRFIRLWKKLGVTIEQTDMVITALYPAADLPQGTDDAVDMQNLDQGFLTLLPRIGIAFQVMELLNLEPDQNLPSLLACWSPIDVHGANSLYRKMFLSPAQLKQDPAFADDGYGNFLQDNTQTLLAHTETLRAAFSLTDAEFSLILAALGFDATTQLTLDTISAVYRRGWLARTLGLSVQELLLLIRFAGLGPFAVPDPPNPSMVRLLQLVQALNLVSLKPVQALYLIWNQDISGKSVPDDREITTLGRTLRANLAALESEFAGADDSNGDITRARKKRQRQQALATVSTATRTESAFAQAILEDANVLHAAADKKLAGLDDLIAVATPGLSAQFFLTNNLGATPDITVDTVSSLTYAPGGTNPLPVGTGGSPIAGIWSGYIDVPQDGSYTISVAVDPGAGVVLEIGGAAVTMVQSGSVWSTQNPISFTPGVLSAIMLTVTTVKNTLTVSWETNGGGQEVIPVRYLYSGTLTDHLRNTYIRFLKVASLATGLKLTGNEIAHFATDPDYTIGGQGWLNALMVSGSPDVNISQALREALAALLDFSRIKATLSPGDERLLAVLQNPAATMPNGDSQLLSLTRWSKESLNALLTRFGKSLSDLSHLDPFLRVYNAYAQVTAFGISASDLLEVTINEPSADMVRTLQLALHARYGEAAWLSVLKPINDELRGLQRDALVAYILQKLKEQPNTSSIDTADKLFEYFLMDVQMDPCMQTSRIRHALSSVQLFIERCLMNLEPQVAPSSIRADQWEWMKRYRTWEANRKVFLWPENWLEPELRDDQSPFFKEAMSQLLQSDITEDSASAVLLDYLSKLEEVAKLEPCSIYYAENGTGVDDDIAHVVARTTGAHRKYYYRRNEYGSWTPWEQIKLDIEDNPVLPVVWKGRLLLFWLRILKATTIDPQSVQTDPSLPSGPVANLSLAQIKNDAKTNALTLNPPVRVQAVLCLSEYYNGKWQPTKTSDVNHGLDLGAFPPVGPNAFDRSKLRLFSIDEGEALRVYIYHNINQSDVYSSFRLYNTHSLPVPMADENTRPNIFPSGLNRFRSGDQVTLAFQYQNTHETSAPKVEVGVLKDQDPFTPFTLIEPGNQLQNSWVAPFFFQDSRHAFYVDTTLPPVAIPSVTGFGLPVNSVIQQIDIPQLVLKQAPNVPPISGTFMPMSIEPHPVAVGTSAIERFVTEGITVRISNSEAVHYDGCEIGPRGGLLDRQIFQD